MDIYGEQQIYISNSGIRLYSYFDFILDVIETNLKCYHEDFFRNEKNFGVQGLNLQDASELKTAIASIITNRLSGVNIQINEVEVSSSQAIISLSGSFGLQQVELSVSDKDSNILKLQKLKKDIYV